MRIGIDAYVTSPNQGGFISYISHLAQHLAAAGDDKVVVYVPSKSPVNLALPDVETRAVEFDAAAYPSRLERDLAWHQEALLGALEADGPDVFLGTSYFLPLRWNGPMVVTVHDLIFERHPEYFTPSNLELYRTWGRKAAERADAIVAVSESSAADVRALWGMRDKPVVATPLGHSLAHLPDDRAESRRIVADALFGGHPTDYILSVAAAHPRKNLPGLLAAYAALPSPQRAANKLLLVNVDSHHVRDRVATYELGDQAVITGRLPDELLPHVYAAARMLAHPSSYEGFGIPVLEAMACGTPVVSSTRPAIPEIAGDAALLVDPADTQAIAEAMARVLTDDELAASLSAAGRERSRRFDWRTTAELTRSTLAAVTAA